MAVQGPARSGSTGLNISNSPSPSSLKPKLHPPDRRAVSAATVMVAVTFLVLSNRHCVAPRPQISGALGLFRAPNFNLFLSAFYFWLLYSLRFVPRLLQDQESTGVRSAATGACSTNQSIRRINHSLSIIQNLRQKRDTTSPPLHEIFFLLVRVDAATRPVPVVLPWWSPLFPT
jgi:hypothetical protein